MVQRLADQRTADGTDDQACHWEEHAGHQQTQRPAEYRTPFNSSVQLILDFYFAGFIFDDYCSIINLNLPFRLQLFERFESLSSLYYSSSILTPPIMPARALIKLL